ncbi:HlyD family efflux transporter periplasmic adaptor subunit [bacterium]|nr:HlyD family efflux transporter periplasmic adaptor subunit [bacterium]
MWYGLLVLVLSVEPAPSTSETSIPGVVLTLMEQADVPAREAGVLMQIAAKEGITVEAGQLLGQIDDDDARLRLEKARTELAQSHATAENDIKVRFAKKSADVAVAELQRAKDAAEKFDRSVSQTELDRLQLLAEKSKLEVEQADIDLAFAKLSRDLKQHDVELAQLSAQRRRITAPITGMVVQWKKHPGEWVEPGQPVVRIIRLNTLRAEGFAPASALGVDTVGSRVTLTVDLPNRPAAKFPGELVFVSPEIDPINGQVRFWAEIQNPKLELRPGQLGSLIVEPSRN